MHLRTLVLCAGLLGALLAPAQARAHPGAPVVALDFRASVDSAPAGVVARVIDGDRMLEVRVTSARRVVVLGYDREPFLLFTADGVAVNERSPTAIADKLSVPNAVPSLDPTARPVWVRRTAAHSLRWHDHRLGHVPGRAYREGDAGGWSIPVLVDGRTASIAGRLRHAEGPPYWPWLVILAVAAGLSTALVKVRSQPIAEVVAVGGAVVAAAAEVALSVSLALASGRTSASGWGNVAFALVIAAAAVSLVVLAPPVRIAVAGLVALFAALASASYVGVLVHGYVIAALPAAAVRALTVTAVLGGTVAVVATATFFLSFDPRRARLVAGARP